MNFEFWWGGGVGVHCHGSSMNFPNHILLPDKETITFKKINKKQLLLEAKNSEVYKKILETFPDAELIDVEIKGEGNGWFY